ncbi:MAG: 16S rRNA (guanine(966)-N(2))-methyltransferase RsmD [Tannerella sp.]|jgi:16S rRNA (guanine(966)-N(2))-methyltransferase RsmD|nr:16S rRNA (guanine(966)-N(2))-methyltransferase RsmD [Tannerella sp.]
MRIISGIYGRRRFQIPSSFKARPTTDFAKENLFNVLNNLICWERVDALDLFAGTGSISFEMLSRGCRSVIAVEQDRSHVEFIVKVAKELKTDTFSFVRGDALRFLNTAKEHSFDLIFADPPYALSSLPDIPRIVMEKNILREGGIFVMEHSKVNDFSAIPFFNQRRVYGSVNFSIFIKR